MSPRLPRPDGDRGQHRAADHHPVRARASRDVPLGAVPDLSARFTLITPKRFDHYSLLRTTEEMLGITYPRAAAEATGMRPGFGL